MEPRPDIPARDKVLFHLKTKGPRTAAQLSQLLDVTPMAVRQHLQTLADDGLVCFADERRKVGRPARVWSLTAAAAQRFPDSHGDLTVELIRAVRTTFGENGLDRLVTERSRQQRESYAARMPPADAPAEHRIAALAAIRTEEGYMAEWSQTDTGDWVLSENHCPICAAATACQGLCREELAMFRELLGPGLAVTRGDHVLAGARRCTYRIEATAAPASKGSNAAEPSPGESA